MASGGNEAVVPESVAADAAAEAVPAQPPAAPMEVDAAEPAATAVKAEEAIAAEGSGAAPTSLAGAENGAPADKAGLDRAAKPEDPPAPAAEPVAPGPKTYPRDVLRKDPRVVEEPVSARAAPCAPRPCLRLRTAAPRSGPTARSASQASPTSSTASICRIRTGRWTRLWYAALPRTSPWPAPLARASG
jgi:hypothetical protein